MLSTILFAAASLAVTNAPSAFSTMVERTVPCPVVTEPKVGMKFDLDLPQSSDCRIEVAVGRDADGDGCLSDDESKIVVEWLRNGFAVRGVDGEVKASSDSALYHGPSSSFTVTSRRVHDVLVLTIR